MSRIRRDIDDRFTVNSSVAAQAISSNTTVNGASTDLGALAPGSKILAVCSVGTRTDGTYTFVVQDSADNSSFATLAPDTGSLAAVSAADTDRKASYTPVAGRPYIRVSVTSASVTTGAAVAGYLVIVPPALV